MNRKTRIESILNRELPVYLMEVLDESSQHHVPEGAETHFKLVLVSDSFKGQSRVARHRLINKLLAEEFSQGLHALSMHLFTEDEWKERQGETSNSPHCRGGFKHG
ncbi:BolA family protein [Legionella genomosp. 1]|uniref:BolA family protein n=1 Tax=Legionella genomosp. 1 TaxID=1093625 RepID=UPI0010567F92|nr:BolA/IbaG family iron-sulfur metabolism protein [Legionella genomosp. 1]